MSRKRKQTEGASAKWPAGAAAKEISDHPLEKENAVEWGERLQTGKMIARGGKATGAVPGATEQPTH